MKSITRMTVILVLIVAVIVTVYVGPAMAGDDTSITAERKPPHPCRALSNLRINKEIALEEYHQQQAKHHDISPEYNRRYARVYDYISIWFYSFLWYLQDYGGAEPWEYLDLECGNWEVIGGFDEVDECIRCKLEVIINAMEEFLANFRESGWDDYRDFLESDDFVAWLELLGEWGFDLPPITSISDPDDFAEYLEEILDDMRQTLSELESIKERLDRVIDKENQAWATYHYFDDRIAEAERECNLTRVSVDLNDVWAAQMDDPMGRVYGGNTRPSSDKSLVSQMQYPMGFDESKPNSDGDSLTSVMFLAQGQGNPTGDGQTTAPQFEATAQKLPYARVFHKLSENLGTDKDQPSSSVTAEMMLAQQPENTNGGKDAIGRTPMLVPPDPETTTTVEAAASDRLFESISNVLRARVVQSESSAAGETSHVQQDVNTSQGKNPVVYTHMPVARAIIQSSEAVVPHKQLRLTTPMRIIRALHGRSRKR